MSVWAKTWAYEQRCGRVRTEGRYAGKYKGNPTAKAVLGAVAEFADERGRCWAGQDTLAEMCDMEERTVREQLAYLEDDLGLIRREERRRPDGTRTSDMIYLLAPPGRLRPAGNKADPRRDPPENCAGGSTGKLRRDNRKTTADQPAQFSPHEPSVEPSDKEEPSPTGANAPEGLFRDVSKQTPARAMTSLTIRRCEEVGFCASPHQKANWGNGWSKFCYAEEGEKPPPPEEQYAVLGEIVAAAAGNRGKGRYFLAVADAAKRARGEEGQPRSRSGNGPSPPNDGRRWLGGDADFSGRI